MIESWRKVLRAGVFPQLSDDELRVLWDGLSEDDPNLIQGATTSPPPLQCVADWPVESACLLAYPGWKTGLATVAEVEERFARLCFECDCLLGEPAACRWLLNWYDDTPRAEMRRELLAEVEAELVGRRVRRLRHTHGVAKHVEDVRCVSYWLKPARRDMVHGTPG
jgi:hypothetical protein